MTSNSSAGITGFVIAAIIGYLAYQSVAGVVAILALYIVAGIFMLICLIPLAGWVVYVIVLPLYVMPQLLDVFGVGVTWASWIIIVYCSLIGFVANTVTTLFLFGYNR